MHPKGKHALELARAGIPVMFAGVDDPDLTPKENKANQWGGWQKRATTNHDTIVRWWRQANWNVIAVANPRSDVVMLDYDGEAGEKTLRLHEMLYDLPKSYRVKTPNGWHVYLRLPPGVFISNHEPEGLGAGVNVRGNASGGLVYAAGSTISGREYKAVGKLSDIAPFPPALLELFTTSDGPELKTKNKQPPLVELDLERNVNAAIEYLKERAPVAIEGSGSGDTTTYEVACAVLDFGLSPVMAFEIMDEYWNDPTTGGKAIPPWDPDGLQTKIANAWDYRKDPVGKHAIADPLDEFNDVSESISDKPNTSTRKRHALSPDELRAALRPFPYLIQDLIPKDATVVFFGDTSIGKSLVLLDMGVRVALGLPYRGRETEQGLVAYVAAEGGIGSALRYHAWLKRHGIETPFEDIPFALIPYRFNALDKKELKELSQIIKDAEQRYACKCKMIILDTLARTMIGDDWRDMGLYVTGMDYLRECFDGATVATIHHTGKDKSRGARGGYQLKCDVDVEFELQPGKIKNTKTRDGEKQPDMFFGIEKVVIEPDHDGTGKPITAACAIEKTQAEVEFSTPTSEAERNLDRVYREYMADIRKVMAANGGMAVSPEDMKVVWSCGDRSIRRKRLERLASLGILLKTEIGRYSPIHDKSDEEDDHESGESSGESEA